MKIKNETFEWRTGRSCQFKIFLHLVFTTKYRRNVLSPKMITRLEDIYRETLEQMDGELIEFNGEHDHVHLMISATPKTAISNLVSKLKGKSSYMLRKEFWSVIKPKLWGKHFWSPSYCAVSCGGAPLEVVKSYIENQRMPPSKIQINRSKRFTGKTRANGTWQIKENAP